MKDLFRVVAWNCRNATKTSGVWDYLLEMNPDVALLQEVRSLPEKVLSVYTYLMHPATNVAGLPQRFNTALLVKGNICKELILPSPEKWVEEELRRYADNFVAVEIAPDNSPSIKAISVHAPAWPIDRERLSGIDVSRVRLTQNRDVWVADLLWASLKHQRQVLVHPWIVAGDFNLSETFDWRRKPRGNREYLDRMAELGLIECLRYSKSALTPTFRNLRGSVFKHQIDHLFVSPTLAQRLIICDTGSSDRVFGCNLSDHLPIVADFRVTN